MLLNLLLDRLLVCKMYHKHRPWKVFQPVVGFKLFSHEFSKMSFRLKQFSGNEFESRLCVSSTARSSSSRKCSCIITDTTLPWICIWKLTSISSIHLSVSHGDDITIISCCSSRTCFTGCRVGTIVPSIGIRAVPLVSSRVRPTVDSVGFIKIENRILGSTFAN